MNTEMTPADNVLYFDNNIDVRICPKNGMSSLKELHRLKRGVKEYIGIVDRLHKVKLYGDQFDIPFRKDSFRIAVKRDPIKRFMSACEYIVSNRYRYELDDRGGDLPILSLELDDVLTGIESGIIKNNHFYTQTWYMGKPNMYDIVFDLDELTTLMLFLNNAAELGFDPQKASIHDNRTTQKVYNDVLTESQKQRIRQFYCKDYENGWC